MFEQDSPDGPRPRERERWPLLAKVVLPVVLVLVVVGVVVALQPSSSHVRTIASPPTSMTPAAPAKARASARTVPPRTRPPRPPSPAPSAPAAGAQPGAQPGGATRKTCADFATRQEAEIWEHGAIGFGWDTSGLEHDSRGRVCPSLPGPDL